MFESQPKFKKYFRDKCSTQKIFYIERIDSVVYGTNLPNILTREGIRVCVLRVFVKFKGAEPSVVQSTKWQSCLKSRSFNMALYIDNDF